MRPSVVLVLRSWIDDHEADDGDPDSVMFLDEILVDGEQVLPERDWSKVTLYAEAGDFLQLRIENPPASLLARFTDPVDHLPATADVLLLPVGEITTKRAGSHKPYAPPADPSCHRPTRTHWWNRQVAA